MARAPANAAPAAQATAARARTCVSARSMGSAAPIRQPGAGTKLRLILARLPGKGAQAGQLGEARRQLVRVGEGEVGQGGGQPPPLDVVDVDAAQAEAAQRFQRAQLHGEGRAAVCCLGPGSCQGEAAAAAVARWARARPPPPWPLPATAHAGAPLTSGATVRLSSGNSPCSFGLSISHDKCSLVSERGSRRPAAGRTKW